jgi:large subunit ribosomal protein L3
MMEYIVEKIGMSRTITVPSIPVTLVKVLDAKVCEVDENRRAIVSYSSGKKNDKTIEGQRKKYNLTKEFNRFITLTVANAEVGDLDVTPLGSSTLVKSTFNTKGRGFTGAIKRHGFAGGPGAHGSRFHRRVGSIGNAEWPGRVQRGKKMPGHYGNVQVTVKNDIVSFDADTGVLALKGAIPGANGALGKIRIVK